LKYIQIHHKYTISTFKYIQIHYEYIWIHSNTFKCTQILSNTLKYTINVYYKYIEIYYKYIEIYKNVLQVHWNILKYTINTLKYIHMFSNTLKDIKIYYKYII
jgi:hypothetical protein